MSRFLLTVPIGKRLAVAFGLMCFGVVLVAGLSMYSLHLADVHVRHIVDTNVRKLALCETMSQQIHIATRVLRSLVLLDEPDRIEKEIEHLAQVRTAYDKAWQELQSLPASAQGQRLREEIDTLKQRTRTVNDHVVELARANRDDEARDLLMGESNRDVAAWQAALDDNVRLQEQQNHAEATELLENNAKTRAVLLALSAGALCFTAAGALVITRSITAPIARAVQAAETIQSGRLDTPIDADGQDECASLLRTMQAMQGTLREVVGRVRQNAHSVATASSQIAMGTQNLSSRTEEQASALQQTAASMEQLSSAVRQNADNAARANDLAGGASAVAAEGGSKMGHVITTMGNIRDSSRQIADITSVIDGIAFQTNILALNAAVEAARAGEQGRGFAVVAAEVRTLAQRSADAARQIRTLITSSVEQIEAGSLLVGEAGATIERMVTASRDVTALVGEIYIASREQSTGVEQVRDAVAQMDHVTQQNAALVEESSAAADSLKGQSHDLVEAVARFHGV